VPSPRPVDWTVFAGNTGTIRFQVSGADTPRWLRVTMSSSARTLRSKRVTVTESQSP
jgi:hypothetical protein